MSALGTAQQAHAPDRGHAGSHVNQSGRAAGDARRWAATVQVLSKGFDDEELASLNF
jgi:hypothetical protein